MPSNLEQSSSYGIRGVEGDDGGARDEGHGKYSGGGVPLWDDDCI